MANKMPIFLEALKNAGGANGKKGKKKTDSKKKPPVKKGK